MQKIISVFIFLYCACFVQAQNWDDIQNSGKYYYGLGQATTKNDAAQQAMAKLIDMIADHTSKDFTGLKDKNGTVSKEKVVKCLETYITSGLSKSEDWPTVRESDVIFRRYMERSDLHKIFDERIQMAKQMLQMANEAEQHLKIDMALRYNYWAYCLLQTVQHPDRIKGVKGQVLVSWIPSKIKEILKNIKVSVDKVDGDFADLKILYQGKPVSTLDYTYSNGESNCFGSAKDGRGVIEVLQQPHPEFYCFDVEYQYWDLAKGDADLSMVLKMVPAIKFENAHFTIRTDKKTTTVSVLDNPAPKIEVKPEQNDLGEEVKMYEKTISRVISAISSKRYNSANALFTWNGLEIYNKLIAYGQGRIVGTPDLSFTKGVDGTTMVRGLQMSFSFENGKQKKTFVEDVVFTLNTGGKIENLAFGLGKVATNDILGRKAPGWKNETRELLIGFLENYKTAYCLKRYDYIESIFADDAVIIVGNVVKRYQGNQTDGRKISVDGMQEIEYNRSTKDDYLKRLRVCFDRNEFINIRFSNNDVQRLEKYKPQEIYGIQIRQEYASSSYSDKGYLFLMVDMTKHETPLIKVRTWQPNEVPMEDLYNAGDFYGR